MENKYIHKYILIFGIFFLLMVFSLFAYDYYESHRTMDFFESQDCKKEAWIGCGLEWNNDTRKMCYQTEDNVDSRWEECPIISEKIRDCWIAEVEKCKGYYDRWIEKTYGNEK